MKQSAPSKDRWLGLGYFIHPVPLAAVVLLAVNDHYLKESYPSFLTGKLSDVSGVFFFPLFLCAYWNLIVNTIDAVWGRDRVQWITLRQGVIAIVLTDLIFVAVKVMPLATSFYVESMDSLGFPSRVTADPTDLFALLMNVPTWLFIRKQVAIEAKPQTPSASG